MNSTDCCPDFARKRKMFELALDRLAQFLELNRGDKVEHDSDSGSTSSGSTTTNDHSFGQEKHDKKSKLFYHVDYEMLHQKLVLIRSIPDNCRDLQQLYWNLVKHYQPMYPYYDMTQNCPNETRDVQL